MKVRFHRIAGCFGFFHGVLILAQLAFSLNAFAADLYVGGAGDPYATIGEALEVAAPGDTIILRGGTYEEDITISKPGITIAPELGATATIDGNVTVTADAHDTAIVSVLFAEGTSVVAEDGVFWPNAYPTGSSNDVLQIITESSGMDIAFGDLAAEIDALGVVGVYIGTGSSGTINHSGNIVIKNEANGSSGRGASFVVDEDTRATIGSVDVEAGQVAIGVHFFTSDDAALTVTGDVVANARDATSSAQGVGVSGQSGVHAEIGNVEVYGGSSAGGITFNVTDRGVLTQSGDVEVKAREVGSEAFGVGIGATDALVASIGSVSVTAGKTARGVTTVYEKIGGTDRIADDATITINGAVVVTTEDNDSQAYGIHLEVQNNVSLDAGKVEVQGGELARGIWLQADGDGGSLVHSGELTAQASTDPGIDSEAYGVDVVVGHDFAATVGSVAVTGNRLARAVHYTGGDRGSLNVTGTLTATSQTSSAHGMLVSAGNGFRAAVNNVAVSSGGTTVQGVALNVGDGGMLNQTGRIDVVGTSASSQARGVNIIAGEDFSATVQDIDVEGVSSALGISWTAGDNGSLMNTGTIEATATAANSTSTGVDILADDGMIVTLDDVVATAHAAAWGMLMGASREADISVASVKATATADDSSAFGAQLSVGAESIVELREVVATAGENAWAVVISAGEDLALEIDQVTANADVEAFGVDVAGPNSTITVREGGAVTAESTDTAKAIVVNGAVAGVTNFGDIYASANNAFGVRFGESAAAERVEFYNYGTVTVPGGTGAAVAVDVTESATVSNFGKIDAGDRIAFDGTASTGSIILLNLGEIVGDVDTGAGADRLTVVDTGRIDGDVDLGDGDDEASIYYGAILTGVLDGGTGTDGLNLLGAGASVLPPGANWSRLSAARFEQVLVQGGAWRLDSGTSLGAVDVHDAYLRIDESVHIASLQFHDGALFGEGHVTGNVTNVGGVVSPGNSYGILTVAGDYTQGPGGLLYIELDVTGAPAAGVNYDQLVIESGTAVFEDGTTVRVRPVFGPGAPDRAEYVIVDGDVVFDADAVNLEFELPLLLFYDGWLEHGSMKLVLSAAPFESVAGTENQEAVAKAITEAKDSPDTDLDDLYDWLKGLGPGEEDRARAAYDSLSGEVFSHLPTLASRRLDVVAGAIGRGVPHFASEPAVRVWAVPYSESGRVAAGAGTEGSQFQLVGAVAGVDLFTRSNSRIGLSVGGGTDRLTMAARASEVHGEGQQAGIYGRFAARGADVTALLGYSTTTYRSQRDVRFGHVQRRAKGEFDAADWFASVESRFVVADSDRTKVESAFSLGYYSAGYRSFEEQGAGEVGLIVDEWQSSWWRGRVTVDAVGKPWSLGAIALRPRASLAWIFDYPVVERTYTGRLLGAPANPFAIRGTKADPSGIQASFGLQSGGERWSWSLDYAGEYRASTSRHTVMAKVAFRF